MMVLEDQLNTCWLAELADAAAYDKGGVDGCHRGWKHVVVTARIGLQGFLLAVSPLRLAAVETERTPHPSTTTYNLPHLPKENTHFKQSSLLQIPVRIVRNERRGFPCGEIPAHS